MILKVIACEVFTREICRCVADSPHVIDLEFTPVGLHEDVDVLHGILEEKIVEAKASERNYDAIALCLGICGNATLGLTASGIPLVLPRAHDCCTILLGSRERFKEHFGDDPSTPFSSVGYAEHGRDGVHASDHIRKQMGLDMTFEQCVARYGEENATYVWETLDPQNTSQLARKVVFIEMPGVEDRSCLQQCRQKAAAEGRNFETIEGSTELIRKLVFGEWDEKDFLVVRDGESIAGVYDMDEIIKAVRKPAE